MEEAWVVRRRHHATVVAISVVFGSFWPMAARAYRPFDSTDASVAQKGDVEIELGPIGYLAVGSDHWVVVPDLVLNWGFAERFELVVQARGLLRVAGDAQIPLLLVDETGIFVKAVLREGSLQGQQGPSLATEVGPLLPTINGATGVGAWWGLIASQRWSYLTVHLNPAFVWSPAHTTGFFGGMIIEGNDSWAVRPVAELVVETEEHAPTTFSGLAGAIWRVSESLSLDAALRRARIGDTNVTEIRAGLTWGFAVGFPK